jgi:predicted RecB family nuclease
MTIRAQAMQNRGNTINKSPEQRREQDDHLSLVANITTLQTTRLNDNGIPTLRALAAAAPDQKPPKMQQSTFNKLRRQARLQEEQRTAIARGDAQPYRYEFLESGIRANGIADDDAQRRSARGFYRLPEPSPGAVFFDMEGDPYYDIGTGLEYLFGAYTGRRVLRELGLRSWRDARQRSAR